MNKRIYDIEGMTCSSCKITVENAVKKLGVNNVNVSIITNKMEIADDSISDEKIINAIKNSGYNAIRLNSDKKNIKTKNPKESFDKQANELKKRLYISIPIMIFLMYIAMGDMLNLPYPTILKGYKGAGIFSYIQFILTIPIIMINKTYFTQGFRSLFKANPNMDTLVALGATSATIYGVFVSVMILYGLGIKDEFVVHRYMHDLYFETAVMILTFINLGKYLETKSKAKTTESINKLIDLKPEKVRLVTDSGDKIIPIEELKKDDIIKLIPGEKIGVDGIIVEGNSSLDTSAITGEPMPLEVGVGERVISGSINNNGSFKMKVTSVGEDTTISKIISLMEEASATKAPISKLADKISGIFVPIVIAISIISFIAWLIMGYSFTFSLSIAIGVLVISCPCALGLATPVSMMVSIGKAADNGILVKNAESLELLHKLDYIIFDKTGTITRGKPVLTDIVTVNNFSIKKSIQIASALEKDSQHPLAKAILDYAVKNGLDNHIATNFMSFVGKGVEGLVESKKYYIGNEKLMLEKNIFSNKLKIASENLKNDGKTCVFLFDEKEILAIFGIADSVKVTSKNAIDEIKKLGIKTVMLTGDNRLTAKRIAKDVGIDEVESELLPQDKERIVRKYQEDNKIVAMVGDGINDAPAIMRADVGIGIADGTDIAIESADLILMKSDLQDILGAIKLSKATIKNVKQNLFWAFFYNVLAIPVAIGVLYPAFGLKLNPMIAALAMSLSSVFVVSNALRLRKFEMKKINFNNEDILSYTTNYDNINLNNKLDENNNFEIKGEENMEKRIIEIEGMSCSHCKMAVEKELLKVSKDVEVSLEDKKATVLVNKDLADDVLIQAVLDAGYEAVSVK